MSGRSGTVVFAGGAGIATVEITSWSAELTAETADTTAMHATDFSKNYVPTFTDWTASVEGVFTDTINVNVLGAAAASLKLRTGAANSVGVSGNAICTGISMSVGKDDAVTVSLTFQGSGAATIGTVA